MNCHVRAGVLLLSALISLLLLLLSPHAKDAGSRPSILTDPVDACRFLHFNFSLQHERYGDVKDGRFVTRRFNLNSQQLTDSSGRCRRRGCCCLSSCSSRGSGGGCSGRRRNLFILFGRNKSMLLLDWRIVVVLRSFLKGISGRLCCSWKSGYKIG